MTQTAVPGVDPQIQAQAEGFRRDYRAVQAEIAKAIVGHEDIVDGVLTCLFVGGHALLEGVPGLGKTALIRSLASATNVIMENDRAIAPSRSWPGRSSRRSCWPTKSTAPRPRRKALCSKRCRNTR
jgi:hypothetical protein